jgi:hypothetical protein
MRLVNLLCATILLTSLSGCQTYHAYKSEESLNEMSKDYMKMLRWGDYEIACTTYMATDVRKDCLKLLVNRGLKITDYRFRTSDLKPAEGKAIVRVEVDYYLPPSVTVKTVDYEQLWEYRNKNGGKTWEMVTLPPEFK